MTQQDFQLQVTRLLNTYGKQGMPEERAKILWREVQRYEGRWFAGVVDKVICSCRQSPLYDDFAPYIAQERERLWRIEKQQHANDAKSWFSSSFGDEEVRWICGNIKAMLRREISDSDYQKFLQVLENHCRGER